MENARFLVVEGPIGVGKSKLAAALAEAYGGRALSEPTGDNPFLAKFYRDPAKHRFQAQLFFLLSRLQWQKELLQQDLFHQTTVVDALFERDRIYASLNLDPSELALYEKVYESLGPRPVQPDLVIYLQARLDVLLARIRQQGRDLDLDLEPSYLARVCSAYSDFFFHYEGAPLLVVDTTDLDLDDPADLDSIVSLVKRHRGGVQHYILKSTV